MHKFVLFGLAISLGIAMPLKAIADSSGTTLEAKLQVCSRFAYTKTEFFSPGEKGLPTSDVLFVRCLASEVPSFSFPTTSAVADELATHINQCGGTSRFDGKVFSVNGWVSLNCLELYSD